MSGVLRFSSLMALVACLSSCDKFTNSFAGSARNIVGVGTGIGIDLNTIAFWDGSRPFYNLIYGSNWSMRGPAGSQDVPAEHLDADGWIKSLPSGYRAYRVLSMPAQSADIVCHWQGNDAGSMELTGDTATNYRRTGRNQFKFHYQSTYPRLQSLPTLSFGVTSPDYVRNIDCRESSSVADQEFDRTFLNTLKGFRVIRFLKWQFAVEANSPVSWSTRNKQGDGSYWVKDGVPVETMISLANEAQADPWFSMPWNADDDYVRHFAQLVRGRLAPGRKVYVEVSNEVWNGSYPVMHQAEKEGTAEGLAPGKEPYAKAMYRYAEKTRQVMKIWSSEFADQPTRLVRVMSTQNVNPYWSEQILGLEDTAANVDALATAPYWAFMDSDYRGQSSNQILETILPQRIDEAIGFAKQQRSIARKFGKRYISYEGGQHVWLNNHPELVAEIERDPRMADLYRSYITRWNSNIGDTLTLFCLTGGISTAGFGLVEYSGQPIEQAPKMRAVQTFLH